MGKIVKHSVELSVFESVSELSEQDQELVKRAKKVSETAYAPYSQFYVGAAIRLSSEEIVAGSNQENMAYPSGLCAERVAIYYANSAYPNQTITTIAVVAKAKNFEIAKPVAPCGACRQAMAEYELKQKEPIRLIMVGGNDEIYISERSVSLDCNAASTAATLESVSFCIRSPARRSSSSLISLSFNRSLKSVIASRRILRMETRDDSASLRACLI